MKACAYMRVSTNEQDCQSQEHAIAGWLATHPGYEVTFFKDEGISGKKDRRPALDKMLAEIGEGAYEAVIVFRLDRLSRNASTALRMLLDWMRDDVAFYAVDQPILHLGKDNPLRLTITSLMAEISQIEREAIVSRVRAGLSAAKARGVKLGASPKLTAEQVAEVKELRAKGYSTRQLGRRFGVSCSTISRWG